MNHASSARRTRGGWRAGLLAALCGAVWADCDGRTSRVTAGASSGPPETTDLRVTLDPFGIHVVAGGRAVLEGGTFAVLQNGTWFYALRAEAPGCLPARCEGTVWLSDSLQLPFSVSLEKSGTWLIELGPSPETGYLGFAHRLRGHETILGLGEVFDGVTHNGRRRAMHLEAVESETGFNEVRLPVPFYISTRGFAVWIANRESGYVDVGRARADRLQVEFLSRRLTLHLYAGSSPRQLVERYSEDSGRPPMPPPWAFGVHAWFRGTGSDAPGPLQRVATDQVQALRSFDFPASVFLIDSPFETAHHTYEFDRVNRYPDPEGLISFLHREGFQVLARIDPRVNEPVSSGEAEIAPTYEEAVKSGLLVLAPDGNPFLSPWAHGTGALIDFTNPDALRWAQGLAARLLQTGIRGWKLEGGDEILPAAENAPVSDLYRFKNGLDSNRMHGLYRFLYHRTFRDATQQVYGGDWFSVARTGTYGSQSLYTCVWPGDLRNDFRDHTVGLAPPFEVGGLPAAVWAGLNLGASGFPFYGSAVGGRLGGPPEREVLIRWAQFAAFSPVMLIGADWQVWPGVDDEARAIVREFARLHISLFPYLYAYAERASFNGTPVVRSLPLEFPDDPAAATTEPEYVLGDSILVAPIVHGGGARDVYLPEGDWIDYWDETAYAGPTDLRGLAVPLDRIPLFIRVPSVLPLLPEGVDTLAPAENPDVKTLDRAAGPWRLHLYPSGEGETRFSWPGGGSVILDSSRDVSARVDLSPSRRVELTFHLAALPHASVEGVLVDDHETSFDHDAIRRTVRVEIERSATVELDLTSRPISRRQAPP